MTSVQRIVLVGFMGAGKSTVARLVAERLGWNYVDLDQEIERRAGMSVPEIFRLRGEAEFRRLERDATTLLAACTSTVIAAGGGWMIQPGLADVLRRGALLVWLRVSPDVVIERLAHEVEGRPLLRGGDRAGRVAELLAEREVSYARADVAVSTDGLTADEVADGVERAVRSWTS